MSASLIWKQHLGIIKLGRYGIISERRWKILADIKLPVGIDSFEKLCTNECYYIDKTGFIKELLDDKFEVYLITRPRRFGKTLIMSMLAEFFDIRKNSESFFDGLEISQNSEICSAWMNQYPVLFLSLKKVEGLDFMGACAMLASLISDLCIQNYYLVDSKKINEVDKNTFLHLANRTATLAELKNSLYTIMRMLQMHYGKKIILLIDEYDVPLAKASENGYYTEMLDVIRSMMGSSLKTNDFLEFAVITGCLRIAKESIFTGTNNFVSNSISGERYKKYFGFTETEVKKLLADTGFSDHAEEMAVWYDGYRFGSMEVYCPWDVLNYVVDLRVFPNAKPGNYWRNTSHNGIIRSFIDRTDLFVNDKFEILLSGGCIPEKICEDMTYDMLHSSEENFWSVLYLTGYLTQADINEYEGELFPEEGKTWLKIPNEEIKTIFADTVAVWFTDTMRLCDRAELFEAFWNGEEAKVTELVTDILFDTISYFDYKEDYYHAFLAGIFTGAGYAVESNHEHGLGRPDIVIRDRKKRRVLIIEVKHSKDEKDMEKDSIEALDQIGTKKYADQFLRGYRVVVCYGAAFFEKECIIKKME